VEFQEQIRICKTCHLQIGRAKREETSTDMMLSCYKILITKVDQIVFTNQATSGVTQRQITTLRFRTCVTKKTIINNRFHHSNRITTRSKEDKAIIRCHHNMFSTRVLLNPKTKSILQRRQIKDKARIVTITVRGIWEIIKRICPILIKTKTVVLKLITQMKGKKRKLWIFRFQMAKNKHKNNKR
jgi:hypothetical protein